MLHYALFSLQTFYFYCFYCERNTDVGVLGLWLFGSNLFDVSGSVRGAEAQLRSIFFDLFFLASNLSDMFCRWDI